jgi:hypothetical protein
MKSGNQSDSASEKTRLWSGRRIQQGSAFVLRNPTIGEATGIYASFVHPAMSHSTHCPETAFGEARADAGTWVAATSQPDAAPVPHDAAK